MDSKEKRKVQGGAEYWVGRWIVQIVGEYREVESKKRWRVQGGREYRKVEST